MMWHDYAEKDSVAWNSGELDVEVEEGHSYGGAEDDEFDDDTIHETAEEGAVQLGIMAPMERPPEKILFKNIDWHDWDGGKAGGWPVWLNPRDFPATEDMRCGECASPLAFLIQLYCPLDHEEDAFHRCLYIFCCPKETCSKNSSTKALRCQLPRENAFYPYEPDNIEAASADNKNTKRLAGADPAAWGVTLCCVCGQRAKSACSKCKRARYCGKQHQAEHWKSGGHKKVCSDGAGPAKIGGEICLDQCSPQQRGDKATTSRWVFREFEVDVQPEPPPTTATQDRRSTEDTLFGRMGLGGADGDDEDSKLSQAELDKIAGVHGVKDKVTLQFLSRTQANAQVIRYDTVGAGPLWSSSRGVPGETDIPPCERCGRARKFEFQVMPHLLHYLGVDAKSKALSAKAEISQGRGPSPPTKEGCMDWGTLAVYTCPDSCSVDKSLASYESSEDQSEKRALVGYVEEFVWRQPPP